MNDVFHDMADKTTNLKGILALSPLIVFLGIYLISSVLAGDFYRIPIASAFLIASAYALMISGKAPIEDKLAIFSKGAGHKNVLLMLWIFILAGAFAETARQIGAIDATVNATLSILPPSMLFVGLFIASCFISMAIGTSVGTIVALVPVAAGIASESGLGTGFITAIVAGGAFFGDNLSFISDTTIAATKTQGCLMADKFKVNLRIVAPAAMDLNTACSGFSYALATADPHVVEVAVARLRRRLDYLIAAHAKTLQLPVFPVQSAVNALPLTDIREFYYRSQMDNVPDMLSSDPVRQFEYRREVIERKQ